MSIRSAQNSLMQRISRKMM